MQKKKKQKKQKKNKKHFYILEKLSKRQLINKMIQQNSTY